MACNNMKEMHEPLESDLQWLDPPWTMEKNITSATNAKKHTNIAIGIDNATTTKGKYKSLQITRYER